MSSQSASFAAAGSEHPLAAHAVGEVCGQLADELGPGPPPDVIFTFVSGDHLASIETILRSVDALMRPRIALGAASTGTLAGGRQVIGRASLALWAARFGSSAELVAFDVTAAEGGLALGGTGPLVDAQGHLIVLGNPDTLPTRGFLQALADRAPELTVLGGLVPPVGMPAAPVLLEGTAVRSAGAFGLRLGDEVPVGTVVAQGCRPVGQPMTVTGVDGSRLTGVAGETPLVMIRRLAETLDPGDRELATRGLHLGVVTNERRDSFGRGDFVVHDIAGADPATGALALADPPTLGQLVQFQVSDPASAEADLDELLGLNAPADAALVFSCVQRASGFFAPPMSDAAALCDTLETSAVAGLFCVGEIGPIGGGSRLHTLTATAAVFGGPRRDRPAQAIA
ncbi:MAG: FIST C-terminal domain-containing protein [Microthrixaceae bacterium]